MPVALLVRTVAFNRIIILNLISPLFFSFQGVNPIMERLVVGMRWIRVAQPTIATRGSLVGTRYPSRTIIITPTRSGPYAGSASRADGDSHPFISYHIISYESRKNKLEKGSETDLWRLLIHEIAKGKNDQPTNQPTKTLSHLPLILSCQTPLSSSSSTRPSRAKNA